jgi:tripartite ATP-independent transporter DctM subunit
MEFWGQIGGLLMLALACGLLLGTGLPAYAVLIGAALLSAVAGVASGVMSIGLLTALPARVVGLLENDLLQALPLYVLMGSLLNRLPLADTLFRAGTAALARSPAGPLLAAVGLGALLAPMNGSVAASVATLARVVQPNLLKRGVPAGRGLAVVCVASTLGVVVPPSLVLILLGDAMMRAHTEAVNATGVAARIINTQDMFRGALVPAGLFLTLCLLVAWWLGRRDAPDAPKRMTETPLGPMGWLTAAATLVFVTGLLAAVAVGYLYAVEAAASGAAMLLTLGLASGALNRATLDAALRDTLATTGALFALFIGATTFTLVFRGFGSDRLLAELVAALPGGQAGALAGVLAMIAASAFVLDAFEIIFVVVPVLMPPLLTRVPDAVWVSVLTLLALQTSFLIPPFGYAVMMVRGALGGSVVLRTLIRALLPFLTAQALVFGLVLALPQLVHMAEPSEAANAQPTLSDDDARERLRQMTIPLDD